MIAALILIQIGLTVMVLGVAAWRRDIHNASATRRDWNAGILLDIVRTTPQVLRALDVPEPPWFRVPPWCSTGTVTAVWVDR